MTRQLVYWLVLFVSFSAVSAQTTTQSQDCAEAKGRVSRLEIQLQDWPALARYRDANARLSAPTRGQTRVVFIGDSITDSWKLADYFADKPFVNRGISGQTTPQMLIRFRPDVIALTPAVVVILAGTNDIAGNTGPMSLEATEGNIASMVELARSNGIRVVLASLLPTSDYAEGRDGKPLKITARWKPDQIRALNDWIRKFAVANRVTFLDYYSAMVDEKGFLRNELSNDGLHPNADGYARMAPLVEKAIAAALRQGARQRKR